MKSLNILIDTNIIIPLEDSKPLEDRFAELQRICNQYSVTLWVHEASKEDIKRDTDEERKKVTLSKFKKFPVKEKVITPSKDNLEQIYGTISNDNDYIDCILLHSVADIGVCDILLSEDQGLHKRAKSSGHDRSVIGINDALEWIKSLYEPKEVRLPKVVDRACHEIDLKAPIFESLREDYPPFDNWFKEKCCKANRHCWTVELDSELAGILIWKDEASNDAPDSLKTFQKILKVCTYKVSDTYRGEKYGELLLKQALWFTYKNAYDVCYLTVFDKHDFLIKLLENYGFYHAGKQGDEEIYAKRFQPIKGEDVDGLTAIEYLRQFYPSYRDDVDIHKFIIPIKPDYHGVLFPEKRIVKQENLFAALGAGSNAAPGNSIRKIYLSHAPCKSLRPGDIIIFYMSKNENFLLSQHTVPDTVG